MVNENESTALIIEHRVRRGAEKRYEKWSRDVLEQTKKSPGYIGREIFPPSSANEPYIIIVRFQTEKDLQTWLASPERQAAIKGIDEFFEDSERTEIKAGIDVWFAPKNSPKPPVYKQILLTAAVIYPLAYSIPRLLSPLFELFPILKNPLLSGLIVTLIIVCLMTFLIMPFLTKLLHGWLYANVPSKN